jgi:CheY-like chemotaxis protein
MVTSGKPQSERRVLIVDPSAESREVLSLALRLRGVRTEAAAGGQASSELARRFQPDLIVVDDETDWPAARSAPTDRQEPVRMIVLGSARGLPPRPAGTAVVAKPYHYRPLIRKIEKLLRHVADPAPAAPAPGK